MDAQRYMHRDPGASQWAHQGTTGPIQERLANLIITDMKNILHLVQNTKGNESLEPQMCLSIHEWAFRWGNEDNLVAGNSLTFSSWRQTHHQVWKESLPPSSCIPTARYSSVNLLALCSFVLCRNSELGPAVLFSQHTPKEFLGETFILRAHSGITEFPLYNSLKGNSAQMSWIYWREN